LTTAVKGEKADSQEIASIKAIYETDYTDKLVAVKQGLSVIKSIIGLCSWYDKFHVLSTLHKYKKMMYIPSTEGRIIRNKMRLFLCVFAWGQKNIYESLRYFKTFRRFDRTSPKVIERPESEYEAHFFDRCFIGREVTNQKWTFLQERSLWSGCDMFLWKILQ
jgi:hypothetical protein